MNNDFNKYIYIHLIQHYINLSIYIILYNFHHSISSLKKDLTVIPAIVLPFKVMNSAPRLAKSYIASQKYQIYCNTALINPF